jgi:hypothetical protein
VAIVTVSVQVQLSDEEDKIVEIYRIEHNKKSNEQAIKEIIRQYKPLSEFHEKNKTSLVDKLRKI